MEKIKKWMRWETDIEFFACVHGISFVLVYGFLLWLKGQKTVSFAVIFEMVVLGYAAAWFQKLLFLKDRVYKRKEFILRSVLWIFGPLALVVVTQHLFGWFLRQPVWIAVVFDIIVLSYFGIVYIYIQTIYKEESSELNRMLKEYQTGRKEDEDNR